MDDLISRQAAIDAVHYEWDLCLNFDGSGTEIANDTEKALCDVPSADVQPVRHGHWIIPRFGADAKCSVCGYYFNDAYDMENEDNYCRHCGARMDEVT